VTGLQAVALALVLYLAAEAIAVPFGHAIGKRVGVGRVLLIIIAAVALVVVGIMLVGTSVR
jgi:hypothetical protein